MSNIKKLKINQISYARKLLKDNDLPYSDIENKFIHLFSVQQDNRIIGIIGFEQYGEHGLLRSFVIEEQHRSRGLGAVVLHDLEKIALQQGITEFYLLTTTADKFFAEHGFTIFDRQKAPEYIKNSSEFKNLCPESAICMRKNI